MVHNPGARARGRDPNLIVVRAFTISVAAGGFMLATTPLGLVDHHQRSSMESHLVINFVSFTLGLLLVYLWMVGATTRAPSPLVSTKAAKFLVCVTLTLSLTALLFDHPLIFPAA